MEYKDYFRNEKKAKEYKLAYTTKSFKTLTSLIVAIRERLTIKKILMYLKLKLKFNFLNANILDIPCGAGKLADVLRNFGEVTASDISLPMISLSGLEYHKNKNFRYFVINDASQLGLKENSFNLIICLRLMQRLNNDSKLRILQEFKRVTSKYLIISFNYPHFLEFRYKVQNFFYPRENAVFSEKTKNIEKLLNASGWKIINKWKILPFFSKEIIYLCNKF